MNVSTVIEVLPGPGSELAGVALTSCESWQHRLAAMSAELKALTGSTESEFLDIGSRLHSFYLQAGEINEMSSEIANLVSGNEVAAAIKDLTDIVGKMTDYLHLEDQESGKSAGTLRSIDHMLDTIAEPIENFKKINKVLRMLGTSTKIESARLGQAAAGFDSLADDVTNLSVQVSDKSSIIRSHKEELSSDITRTLGKLVTIEGEHRVNVGLILDNVRSSISILGSVNARCSTSAADISASSGDVWRSISEVVTSMQFHDITRQQMEHVYEAFDEIVRQVEVMAPKLGSGTNLSGESSDLIADIADVCELQAAQLRLAGDDLVGAVRNIIANLHAVVNKEAALSSDMRQMAGVADQTGTSFFTGMESDLTSVSKVLAESAESSSKLASAIGTVTGAITRISGFVTDIETIGEEIELIALNAQIKAACTGADGAALGVLAEAIQKLAVDARLQTEAVSSVLKGINDATSQLCAGIENESSLIEGESRLVASELKEMLQSLSRVNERIMSLLARMDGAVRSLAADIERTTDVITVHVAVSEALGNMVPAIDAVVSEARKLVPKGARRGTSSSLRKLAELYTMQSERKVHASVLGGKAAGVMDISVTADGDLDDNVELF